MRPVNLKDFQGLDIQLPAKMLPARNRMGQRVSLSNRAFPAASLIFVLIVAGYWLTYSGNFGYVTDGDVTYNEARMLVEQGRLVTPPNLGRLWSNEEGELIAYVKKGPDGRYYSKYGPGMSLVEAPLILIGKLWFPQDSREGQTRFLLSLLNPSLLAAAAVVLFWTVGALGYSFERAVFMAFGYAFTTFVWPYSSYDYSEPLQALCIGAALLCIFRWRGSNSLLLLALAGLFAAFAAATKATLFLVAPWLCGYVILCAASARRISSVFTFALPIVLTALLLGWFNYARFGWALDSGYSAKETFSTPFMTGFFGLSLSLNKGIFVFAPLALLVPFGIRAMRQRRMLEVLLITGICLTNLILYSPWWAWQGGLSWGPRFLLPVTGALLILVAPALDYRALKFAAVVLAMLGFIINVGGAVVDDKAYSAVVGGGLRVAGLDIKRGAAATQTSLVPEFSQISGHFWLAAASIHGQNTGTGFNADNIVYQTPPWILRFPQIVPQPNRPPVFSSWILRR